MRISTTLALAAALTATAACKKKGGDKPAPTPEGSGGMTASGSDGSGGMTASGSGGMAGSAVDKPLAGNDLAKRYLDCTAMINANDMDKFLSTCVADSYKLHDAAQHKDLTGKDALKGQFAEMRTTFPDLKLEPQVVLVNGRRLVGVILMSATMKAKSMKGPDGKEVPETDKKIGHLFFHRLVIDDANHATEEWATMDAGTMMGQIGLAPKGFEGRPLMDKGMEGAPMVVVATDNDTEKTNVAAYNKSNDAFNAHKAADLAAILSDDSVESDQAAPKDTVGKAAIQKDTEGFMTAFSDAKIEVPEVWAAGDFVVGIGTFTGTNDHDMGPIKKSGAKVTAEFAEIGQLKDGKITKMWRFRNGMDFMAAMMGGGGGGKAPGGKASGDKPKDTDDK